MGAFFHPVITMHTFPLGSYMKAVTADDWDAVAQLMESSAAILESAGAQIIICPDNTIHQAFNRVRKKNGTIWLHIADEVAREAQTKGYRKLGLLGTKYLMEGPVYPQILEKYGMSCLIPSADVRNQINNLIFKELVNGIFLNETQIYFEKQIDHMKDQKCDAVVLGCTEIPLIVNPETSSLPTLDSTRILARAALREALINEDS
jgi:aspartate racemase